ncbi:hypothetical protein Tco_1293733 [Tanacetum coccineum]
MGDENPIRTLGDYSKPSHEGYINTIELPVGNNVKGIDYAAGGRLRKLRPDKAWSAIERIAQYEDEGWNDSLIPDEVKLNHESPDIMQLLGIMEHKVDTLMKDAISLMKKSREDKERIKENENKPRKIEKITKNLNTKVLENSAKHDFLENLEKKAFPTPANLLCAMSKRARSTRGQTSLSREEIMEEKVRKFGLFDNGNHQMNYNNLDGCSIHSRDVVDWEFLSNKGL